VPEQLRRALVGVSSVDAGEERLAVTVSVGAALAAPGDTPDALIARADAAIYASKQHGRNRVTLARAPG